MSDRIPTPEESHELERFLYEEAHLLDERRYEEWLALFTDDARYWMPTRKTLAKSQAGSSVSVDEELSGEGELGYFEETKISLLARVLRLRGGIAWAEDPPSRTRRIVSNVHVTTGDAEGEYQVRSNLLLYRTRHQTAQEILTGCRHDVVRRTDEGLRLAGRKIILDAAVLASPNLSVFL